MALPAVVAGGAQAATAGNSENAKKCQKGGWNDYVTSDGAAFASEEECTSYGAKGGQLQPKSAARQICEDAGATFRDGGSSTINGWPLLWSCKRLEFISSDATAALSEQCRADGGIGSAYIWWGEFIGGWVECYSADGP